MTNYRNDKNKHKNKNKWSQKYIYIYTFQTYVIHFFAYRFPCISRNDFDNNYYPLCSFVTSINLPAQVSTPGKDTAINQR